MRKLKKNEQGPKRNTSTFFNRSTHFVITFSEAQTKNSKKASFRTCLYWYISPICQTNNRYQRRNINSYYIFVTTPQYVITPSMALLWYPLVVWRLITVKRGRYLFLYYALFKMMFYLHWMIYLFGLVSEKKFLQNGLIFLRKYITPLNGLWCYDQG